ncbi:hypothetical protein EYZ11_010191 [Aspergillus tanneri]|uniref:Uncharacterized protein n=1 Tax=Aspergillus tanneri TaxID=1220188 RepID=A0A4S3J605_9EURO|nr:hypothetical protein EYZ11_010191 [Aspergillus tanneri]
MWKGQKIGRHRTSQGMYCLWGKSKKKATYVDPMAQPDGEEVKPTVGDPVYIWLYTNIDVRAGPRV